MNTPFPKYHTTLGYEDLFQLNTGRTGTVLIEATEQLVLHKMAEVNNNHMVAMQQANKRSDKFMQERDRAVAQTARLREHSATLDAQLAEANAALKAVSESLNLCLNQKAKLQAENDAFRAIKSEESHRQQASMLLAERNEARRQRNEAQDHLTELATIAGVPQGALKGLLQHLVVIKGELEQLKHTISDINRVNDQLVNERNAVRAELEQAQGLIRAADKQLGQVMDQRDRLIKSRQHQLTINAELRDRLSAMPPPTEAVKTAPTVDITITEEYAKQLAEAKVKIKDLRREKFELFDKHDELVSYRNKFTPVMFKRLQDHLEEKAAVAERRARKIDKLVAENLLFKKVNNNLVDANKSLHRQWVDTNGRFHTERLMTNQLKVDLRERNGQLESKEIEVFALKEEIELHSHDHMQKLIDHHVKVNLEIRNELRVHDGRNVVTAARNYREFVFGVKRCLRSQIEYETPLKIVVRDIQFLLDSFTNHHGSMKPVPVKSTLPASAEGETIDLMQPRTRNMVKPEIALFSKDAEGQAAMAEFLVAHPDAIQVNLMMGTLDNSADDQF